MSKDPEVGDRVRLVSMTDDPDPIEPGATGTIDWVSLTGPFPQIGVRWDNGRTLMLLPGKDVYEIEP